MASANPWFFAAGLAALATCLTHIVVGGRLFAAPLLASDLRPAVKHTNYFCWHLVTAAIAAMSGAFLWAGIAPEAGELAVAGAIMAGAFVAVNVTQNVAQRLPFARHPQGAFFAIVAALGMAGLANG